MIINTYGIYKITNTVTGKFYIGSSVHLRKRLENHRWELARNLHGNCHLQNSWNKHGKDNFVFEIVLYCDKSMTLYYEQVLIDGLKPAYNIAICAAHAGQGLPVSDETRRKIGEANKGRYRTDETKHRMSETKTGERNPMFGKHLSAEAKQKISGENNCNFGKHPANFGKHPSEETRQRLCEAQKRRLPITEETRRRISEAGKGRVVNEETCKKLSEAHTGKIFTEDHKRKLSEAGKGERNSNFGKHISEEQKKKVSGENHYNFGKHLSEEQKHKISESHLRRCLALTQYGENKLPLDFL